MPRANLYPENDVGLNMLVDSSWSTVRGDENTSADGVSSSTTSYSVGPGHTTGRGGGYTNNRAFFTFDISSVPPGGRITSVKFFLDAVLTSTNKLVIVRSTNEDLLPGASDYGSVFPSIAAYASAQVISTSGSTITLNSAAMSDVQKLNNYFTIAVVGERDYTDSQPASNTDYGVSIRMSETGGTSTDPKLTIDWEDDALFFGTNF